MIRYLNIARLNLALLINSKNVRLEWKRVLRPQEPHPKYFRGTTLSFIPRPGFSLVSNTLLNGKGFPGHSLIHDDR
jgi:hypothetical protein